MSKKPSKSSSSHLNGHRSNPPQVQFTIRTVSTPNNLGEQLQPPPTYQVPEVNRHPINPSSFTPVSSTFARGDTSTKRQVHAQSPWVSPRSQPAPTTTANAATASIDGPVYSTSTQMGPSTGVIRAAAVDTRHESEDDLWASMDRPRYWERRNAISEGSGLPRDIQAAKAKYEEYVRRSAKLQEGRNRV
jgi:hypothetical protein